MLQDRFEMDQASLASIHESKTLAGIFQHIVDDCRVIKIKKDKSDDDWVPTTMMIIIFQGTGRILKALRGCVCTFCIQNCL